MADQVAINMNTLAPATAKPLDSADGRKSRGSRDVRHRTNGNHHHPSASDTDDNYHHNSHNHHNGRRRSRSRTRSRTPSPSHSPSRRGKRNVDAGVGVSHLILEFKFNILISMKCHPEQQTPQTEKDVATATNDVEPLLVNNVPRKNSRK